MSADRDQITRWIARDDAYRAARDAEEAAEQATYSRWIKDDAAYRNYLATEAAESEGRITTLTEAHAVADSAYRAMLAHTDDTDAALSAYSATLRDALAQVADNAARTSR